MELNSDNRVLLSIMKQRNALTALRKDVMLSRTDIEVLAYAKVQERPFTVYQLKRYYSKTNIQQLRFSIHRLETYKLIEEMNRGVKSNPSTYWITMKGEKIMEDYLKNIS